MRTSRLALAVFFFSTTVAGVARAQPIVAPAVDASAVDASPEAEKPGPRWPTAPEPSTTATTPRPDPGPGLRERSSRNRRSNPASGALLILVIVGAIGWYVVKKIRRY